MVDNLWVQYGKLSQEMSKVDPKISLDVQSVPAANDVIITVTDHAVTPLRVFVWSRVKNFDRNIKDAGWADGMAFDIAFHVRNCRIYLDHGKKKCTCGVSSLPGGGLCSSWCDANNTSD
jgi:hypothetical protein